MLAVIGSPKIQSSFSCTILCKNVYGALFQEKRGGMKEVRDMQVVFVRACCRCDIVLE